MAKIQYKVGELRAAGLEAKWGRTRSGAPILLARDPDRSSTIWWVVDARMWARAQMVGVLEAFRESIMLGEFFSVPV